MIDNLMRFSCLIIAIAVIMSSCCVYAADKKTIKGLFDCRDNKLSYQADDWGVQAESGPGWVSMKVGEAEYLQTGKDFGGFVVKKGDKFITNFPDLSNISHDNQIGRIGHVADGINLIKISPLWTRNEFELYFGANDKEDQKLCLLLNDAVVGVRLGQDNNRPWMQQNITKSRKQTIKSREAVIMHENGSSIIVKSIKSAGKGSKGEDLPAPEFETGVIKDPAGNDRLALIFTCKGFAANSYQFIIDSECRVENYVFKPSFDVKSSDDGVASNFAGPVMGVRNPIYTKDSKLDFGIKFNWNGIKTFNGYAELEVIHSLGKPHFYQKVEIKDAKPTDGVIYVKFDPKFSMPGVSEVWARLVGEDGRLLWVERYRMAYEWNNYQPKILVQPDMKKFWDDTLTEMRAIPLEPITERVKIYEDHPKFEIYDVTFNTWDKKRVHAMMFVPKDAKKPLPAIVTAHPGATGFNINKRADGVYGSELRQNPQFVTIIPLIRGHAPDATDIPFNNPWWGPLDSRDAYVARSWYSTMTRTIDYLATRTDIVDMNRIVASGGSQGGALALVTAALDKRVAVCLADCPANCQPQEIMENYSSFGPSRGLVPVGQTLQDLENMLSYYNPVNFCPWITCPTYVGSNIGDLTVHSMGPLAAYKNLTALKDDQKDFYPGFTHFHGSGPGLGVKTKEIYKKMTE